MAVLHLRGQYEITLLFEDDRVGLEGIDRFGKIFFGTVIIPFMALKRKRNPLLNSRNVGRPTRNEVLTKIANETKDQDEIQIVSQELILCSPEGSAETKRKTILTRHGKNIYCYSMKQFNALITDNRKKALENIKKQKNILEKLNGTESLLLDIICK